MGAATLSEAELEILDGAALTTTELNYVDGVTSAIQTQIDAQEAELNNSAGLLAALSDETGTGVAVFSTSPTFTGTVIGAGATLSGTLTANGTFDANGAITLGDNGDTLTIDTSDWDISATGVITNASLSSTQLTDGGTISFDWIDGEIADALTLSGGTINSNNILGTLTTTGALTIGDGGDTISINTNDWDISATGVITNASLT